MIASTELNSTKSCRCRSGTCPPFSSMPLINLEPGSWSNKWCRASTFFCAVYHLLINCPRERSAIVHDPELWRPPTTALDGRLDRSARLWSSFPWRQCAVWIPLLKLGPEWSWKLFTLEETLRGQKVASRPSRSLPECLWAGGIWIQIWVEWCDFDIGHSSCCRRRFVITCIDTWDYLLSSRPSRLVRLGSVGLAQRWSYLKLFYLSTFQQTYHC